MFLNHYLPPLENSICPGEYRVIYAQEKIFISKVQNANPALVEDKGKYPVHNYRKTRNPYRLLPISHFVYVLIHTDIIPKALSFCFLVTEKPA